MFEDLTIYCPKCGDEVTFDQSGPAIAMGCLGGWFRAILEPFVTPFCRTCGQIRLSDLDEEIRRPIRRKLIRNQILAILIILLLAFAVIRDLLK